MKHLLNRALAALLSIALALPAASLAQKISADPTASALAGGEFLAGVQTGLNVKVLPSQILTYTLANLHAVNTQTGTSYTYLSSDRAKLVTHSNASSIAAGLPQATGSFGAGWFMLVQNRGAGTLTVTPTTSTIDGAATLVLTAGQGAFVISDGTNWYTFRSTQLAVSAAGSTKQVQYNAAGSLGAEAGFEYDASTDTLSAVNMTSTGLHLTAASTTTTAGLRLPHGAAPTSPVNGDIWTTSAGGLYARINGATVGPFGAGGGGGLTNFTESVNTSSPNASIPFVRLIATNAATNVDIALTPKGTGALSGQIADSTAAGGDKRGGYAVDWQLYRGTSSNAATSSWSTIGGGANGTASANYATVPGGLSNTASATGAFAAGQIATASAATAVALGESVTASGAASFAHGKSTTASGDYSESGGLSSTTRALVGAYAYSSGTPGTLGGSQYLRFHQRLTTTNATPTSVSSDGSTPSSSTGMVLPNYSVCAFHTLVSGYNFSGTLAASFELKGSVKRNATAGTTTILGSVTSTALGADAGASAWAATAIANTTLGSLEIQVTGAAATSINWTAITDCAQTQI